MEYADFRSHGRIICTIVCTRTWNQSRMNSTQNLYEVEHTKRALLQNSALGLGCVALSTAPLPDEGASATMQRFESSQSLLPWNPANMLTPAFLTALDFAAVKSSLPEAGRWHELHDGQTVLLSAPDDTHVTIVLNLSRALAEWFGTRLGQPIVVENRPGAGGMLGSDILAKARGDTHLVMISSAASHGIGPVLYKEVPYDPLADFMHLHLVGTFPSVLAVNAASPVSSVAELIDLARAKPGEVTYGSGGNGTMNHLVGQLLARATSMQLTHIPYRGSAPAMNDRWAGRSRR